MLATAGEGMCAVLKRICNYTEREIIIGVQGSFVKRCCEWKRRLGLKPR